MKNLLILFLLCFPSLVFAQIRIGILPTEFKGKEVSSQFREEVKETIYKNLSFPSQIEPVILSKKEKEVSFFHYFLKSSIKISKEKAKMEIDLLEGASSKKVYSAREEVNLSQLLSRLAIHCDEIKRRILSNKETPILSQEKESFFSKINPFTKINNLFSKLFSKKNEFDIKIPVPPPSPPPGYTEYKEIPKKVYQQPQQVQPKKEVYPPSPWQWF